MSPHIDHAMHLQALKGWILLLDTATGGCEIVLYHGGDNRLFRKQHASMRGQTEILLPMIGEILAEAQIAYANIGLVVAVTGPGSFTGIRVGLSVANAMQLGLDIPAVGLDAVTAWQAQLAHDGVKGPARIVLETFRDDLFVVDVAGREDTKGLVSILMPDEIQAEPYVTAAGGGLVRVPHVQSKYVQLDFGIVLRQMVQNLALATLMKKEALSPYYLRDADTSESRQKTWRIT